jgi:hypothetical protein
MAYAVANSQLANATSLTITAATAGNLLAAYVLQTGTTSPPTITGYVQGSAVANGNTTSTGTYFFTKTAAGGETSIAPVAGSGGTIQAICYWEISGYGGTLYLDESPIAASNIATNTTYTSPATSTLSASSIILACSSTGSNQNGGGNAWTGTGPMVFVGTTGSNRQMIGGSYIPGVTLSGATFTANWTTSRISAYVSYSIRPTAPPNSGIPPSFL